MANTMLNVYDRQTRKKTAVLQNAYDIVETHILNDIYTLSFTLPMSDEKNKYCEPRHYVRWGDTGELYRIKEPKINDSGVGTITYECEHVITTLCDSIMFGSWPFGGADAHTSDTINDLLQQQKSSDWVLDECDFDRQFEYLWEQENILNALYSVPKEFAQAYKWTFDTTVYPWKLSLKKIDATIKPEFYLRAKSNILSSGTSADYANICTRLYPLGYGEGVNQLTIKDVNDGVPYIQSPKAITDKYGIVEKVLVDRRFENAESLKAYAQSMLDLYQEPSMSRSFSVTDLYPLTSYDWQQAEVGKICRMTQDDTTAYITKTKWQRDKAGDLEIELSTKATDIAQNIADLADRIRIESVYAQGATQLYQHSKDANATPTKGMIMSLYFPEEMRQINKVLMNLKLNKFRSYSQTTESGGSFNHTYKIDAIPDKEITTQINGEDKEISIAYQNTKTTNISKDSFSTGKSLTTKISTSTETLAGKTVDATLTGNTNNSTLTGSSASATLTGTSASATLTGYTKSGALTGTTGSATLTGSSASATLTGDTAKSTLSGNTASATLTGSSASATLTGNTGSQDISGSTEPAGGGSTQTGGGGGGSGTTSSVEVGTSNITGSLTSGAVWTYTNIEAATRTAYTTETYVSTGNWNSYTTTRTDGTTDTPEPYEGGEGHYHGFYRPYDHYHSLSGLKLPIPTLSIPLNQFQHSHEIEVTSNDNFGSHSHSFTIGDHSHTVTIGEHSHALRNTGSHSHDLQGKGSHSHDLAGKGSHNHSLAGQGSHSHSLAGQGPHSHNLSGQGAHSHDLTGTGSHSHDLTGKGNHSHSLQGLGSHNHSLAGQGAHSHSFDASHDHTINIAHQHEYNISHSHKFKCPEHTHKLTIPGHQHTVNIPAHTHGIDPGIYEYGTPTAFDIYVGNVKKATVNATTFDGDITEWLLDKKKNQVPRGSWIDVEIRPNDLAYVVCSVFVQGFVQSRGGGNY